MQSASTTGSPVRAANHEALQRVRAPDLERHHGDEGPAQSLGKHLDRPRRDLGIGEPFLTDEGSSHRGDHRYQVVVGKGARRDHHRAESA